ncbi:hypothetical protein BD309DRAFT_133088 [Dichomitus squalens]|nr:hypothetical protein BD309DRAFT_133088 [Dichomitus squalens]
MHKRPVHARQFRPTQRAHFLTDARIRASVRDVCQWQRAPRRDRPFRPDSARMRVLLSASTGPLQCQTHPAGIVRLFSSQDNRSLCPPCMVLWYDTLSTYAQSGQPPAARRPCPSKTAVAPSRLFRVRAQTATRRDES